MRTEDEKFEYISNGWLYDMELGVRKTLVEEEETFMKCE